MKAVLLTALACLACASLSPAQTEKPPALPTSPPALTPEAPAADPAPATPPASVGATNDVVASTNGNPLVVLDTTLQHLQGKPAPTPGPADSSVAQIVAAILQQSHFSKPPLDDAMSERFLTRYIDLLDYQHSQFLQTDIEEFNKYRTALDDLTKKGDTSPAYEIFTRYLQRLEERAEYVARLLADETFDFTGNDTLSLDRHKQPFPADADEARQLWRQQLRYEYLQEKLAKQKPDEILRTLARRYSRRLRVMKETDRDTVLEFYLTSLAHVYDPHSDYFSKSDYENFSINIKLSLVGIGAQLESEDGYCRIKDLIAGGPAARSNQLKANDRIIGVAQGPAEFVDVVDMNLNKVVELIRGKKGTEVRLQVIPTDAADSSVRKVVSLIRDEIKLEDQEAKGRIYEMPVKGGRTKRLGYIDLPSFYADFKMGNLVTAKGRSTSHDVAALLKKFNEQRVQGLILDLRRNGGGSLEEAIKLAGLFIKEGPVVQIKNPNGRVLVDEDDDPGVVYDGPLMVLTSRFSASASEIVAAALQDYGRALIVGDATTHGKGTVQTVVEIGQFLRQFGNSAPPDAGGAIKLTVQKFYRANGGSTQLKGVTPDIVIPSANDYAEIGERSLDNPMPWDEVPRAEYEVVNRVQPNLVDLKKRSEERLAQDKDYAYLLEDIADFRKLQQEKTVSLNEQVRIQERDTVEARKKARDAERLRRKDAPLKVYDVTVSRAGQPGLPAPVLASSLTGSTNLAAVSSARPNPHDGEDEDKDKDDKQPPVDFTLKEARRILADYAQILSAPAAVAQSVATPAPTTANP